MGRRVRTARGEVVDFDLLRIKEQMASAPPPVDVKQRQDFVERRLRRNVKKTMAVLPDVLVEPKLPSTEDTKILTTSGTENKEQSSQSEEAEVLKHSKSTKPKTKQRARVK